MFACSRMVLNGTVVLLTLIGVLPGRESAQAQDESRWRIYRESDGLAERFVLSVTVSPRGRVWARHPTLTAVSELDGYRVRTISGAGEPRYPVLESRSGQLWSLSKAGLMEFRRDQWVSYPVEVIYEEHQTNPLRSVRPIPLLPAERDHVLVLLPHELVKVNPASRRVERLRSAGQTSLGSFIDLVESRDGGAWVTGTEGLAKLPAPVRMLSSDSVWQEYPLDRGLGIGGLSRPTEDDQGNLVVTGERKSDGVRVVMIFNGQEWEPVQSAPEGARAVWRGPGKTLWAQAKGKLYHMEDDSPWHEVGIPGLPQAQIIDSAVEPGQVFWLATSDGLVRHAPGTWRPVQGMARPELEVLGMIEQSGVGIWMVTRSQLLLMRDTQWRGWDWPRGFSLGSPPVPINVVQDGRILIEGRQEPAFFNVGGERFDAITHPQGRQIRVVLGPLRPGVVFVKTVDANGLWQVETFDGVRFEPWPKGATEGGLADLQCADGSAAERVWLARSNSLGFWDPGLGKFVPAPGAPMTTVRAILAVGGGRLWFGGEGTILEHDGRLWQVLRTGLGRVHALRSARDGTVWVASQTGLWSYSDRAWLDYGPEEGFPAGPVWDVLPDRDGAVWAATPSGLIRHYREADLEEPRTYFIDSTAREVPTTETLAVQFWGQDKWDYTQESRLVFSHRLDQGVWTPFEPATIVFLRDLTAGRHRLAVRAMDRDRNEEMEPAIWEFGAFVPWYAEPRLLVVTVGGLLVAGLLAGLAINRHLRLRRSYAEVERIVEQRTTELQQANEELVHSQKMKALGTLAAGIAHDFNNILSIIKGSAQIIEFHPDDHERVRTRISRIKTMVEQGTGIVQAMLGFSRGPELEARPCDVNRLVSDTVRLVSDQVGPQIRFDCQVAAEVVPVRTVAALIRQMLLNLIFNAVDALGGEGPIRLRTTAPRSLPVDLILAPKPARQYVRIDVVDQGRGIDPEIQRRVFEPFFTTKAFSTRRGTGLGLSMVYEIAKELGVGLRLESQPGQGATFSLFVPDLESKGSGGGA